MAIGHSQGGHAALFTATLATDYAPDLRYLGAVAPAPASDIAEQYVEGVGPGTPDDVPAGGVAYFGYVLRGLKEARPAFDLAGYHTRSGAAFIEQAERLCLRELVDHVAEKGVTIGDSLREPMSEGTLPVVAPQVIDVPLEGYQRPVFLAHGNTDVDLPLALSEALVRELEAAGVQGLTFRVYDRSDRRTVLAASLADTALYVEALFR
ncbi:lipase family protein [Saccharothrix sp. NPDC042600]|uniref:lipase family protein n=1 Tax=Saccharothrix TaxID=2071 RepID=UPI0033C2C480|nr:hypothetical protein GCM10017745_51230 [Saccharothrix mutabilis subsp. capreolus]